MMHFFRSFARASAAFAAIAAIASAQVIVSGAQGYGDGQVHPRLELNDVATNRPIYYALFILSLKQWQAQPNTVPTSYAALSGIHGAPGRSWDGVQPCASCSGALGYCTHSSILFPSWHRAYTALFEQSFLAIVQQVANSWTGSNADAVRAVAQTMRFPYWDMAGSPDANSNTLPSALTNQKVTIQGPNGPQTVDNPLASVLIKDPNNMRLTPFTSWPRTLRHPTSNAFDASDNQQAAANTLNDLRSQVQQSVYRLLTGCNDYLAFSSDGYGTSSCPNSLEAIHNNIHMALGGHSNNGISGGHMSYLPVAAFDPGFWLLHFNVDRYYALWQTLYPESQSRNVAQVATRNTWTIAQGSTQDFQSPLTPFRRDGSRYWTIISVRDWTTFKYTYPEFITTDGSQAAISNLINALYGPNPSQTTSSVSQAVGKSSNPARNRPREAPEVAKRAFSPSNPSAGRWTSNATLSAPSPTGTASSNSSRYNNALGAQLEYTCNIKTPRYMFNSSYVIYLFDGQPSQPDSSTWSSEDNCIGTVGALAGGPHMSPDIISSAAVPLTQYLQKKVGAGELRSMRAEHVNPYLKQNLNWRIVKEEGEISPTNLPGFQAAVFTGSVQLPSGHQLPQWSAFAPQVVATEGKAGGITSEQDAYESWPQPPPSPSPTCSGHSTSRACQAPQSSTTSVPFTGAGARVCMNSGLYIAMGAVAGVFFF